MDRSLRGYALFVVLALMTVLLILTGAVSLDLKTETDHGFLLTAEEEALNGADSGIQYALESIRQHVLLPGSYAAAPWLLLQGGSGENICFKVFENRTGCQAGWRCVIAYGEAVRGGCGDYSGNLQAVSAVRVVRGNVDAVRGILLEWEEAFP